MVSQYECILSNFFGGGLQLLGHTAADKSAKSQLQRAKR